LDPFSQDNIVAFATPPGKSAIAVLRLSGSNLNNVFFTITGKRAVEKQAMFSQIYSPSSNKLIDEVIAIYFKGPKSFTGEDVIEISCHGSEPIKKTLYKYILSLGFRKAEPGEFSLRAFLNGKMDLIKAEGIASLINAQTSSQAEASINHVSGKISNNIDNIKLNLINLLSVIENELNFSENEISITTSSNIKIQIQKTVDNINNIKKTTLAGKSLFSGVRVVLYGKPNSGKSTLFNSLLGRERVIISDAPGTTRDSVEEWIEVSGTGVCLVDTAGIWKAKDPLDKLGTEQTLKQLDRANIVVIIDPLNPGDITLPTKINHNPQIILVQSKSDLNPSKTEGSIMVSSHSNKGLDNLLTTISTLIVDNFLPPGSLTMISERQLDLISLAGRRLTIILNKLNEGVEMDIIASLIRNVIILLEELLGKIDNKDIIKNIFNSFCIGK